MKLGIQEGLLPGQTLREKVLNAEQLGFEGLEIHGRGLTERIGEVEQALKGTRVKFSTICAGFGGCPLDADKGERDKAWNDIGDLLVTAGKLGAVGLIMVPIFGPPRIKDLSPWMDAITLEKNLYVEYLKRYGDVAAKAGTKILVEPLNRYETHLLKRLEDAVDICTRVKHPAVTILADFFHMGIEEDNTAAAIKAHAKWIDHVHLADSQRRQPGTGEKDFRPGFKALKAAKYKNYMTLECGVVGDDRMKALKATVRALEAAMK
ncbi:MAG: sugar phosphate isomerase/epimerase family protein [Planctomycetota bacterium]